MKSLVFVFVCLVGAPCFGAEWSWAQPIAQAKPVSVASCPCGDSCQCADEYKEKYLTYKLYHDQMEQWLANQGHPNRAKVATVSVPVKREVYAEEPVCVNGQCYLPSQARYSAPTSTPYTGGRYTRWFSGFKSFRGGSCANGSCR